MNYTKSPWHQSSIGEQKFVRYSTNGALGSLNICEMNTSLGEYKENAQRIVACVNAMEGIVDPEGFMRSVKEDMEAEAEFNRKADEAIKDTEHAREYLIKEGFDPDEIGKQGATFVRILSAKTKAEQQLSAIPCNIRFLGHTVYGDAESIKAVELVIAQRDQAWKDNKEIREIIGADENEATTDEVRSLMLNYKRAKDQMLKVGDFIRRLTNVLSPGDMVIHAELMRESKLPELAKGFDEFADEFTELVNLVSPGG